jgi:hypothetical protein
MMQITSGPSTPKSDSLLDFAFSGCGFLGLIGRIRKVRYLYLMKEAVALGLLRREDREKELRGGDPINASI